MPCVEPEKEDILNDFITVLEESFDNVKDEDNLDRALYVLELIEPLTPCKVFEKKESSEGAHSTDGPIPEKRSNENEEGEDSAEEVNKEEENDEIVEGKIYRINCIVL